MCFLIDINKQKEVKVTKRNIKCFKVLLTGHDKLRSPYMKHTKWVVGEVKTVKQFKKKIKNKHDNSVSRGIHCLIAYSNALNLKNCHFRSHLNIRIFHMIIPKGSLYWKNNSQICADNAILVSDIPITISEGRELLKKEKN